METNQETDNLEKYGRGGVEGRLLARFRERVVAQALALAPASVLDVGCGEGAATEWFVSALPGAAVTGIEARPEARAAFARSLPGVPILDGDIYALPFAERSVDLAVCTEVLEHLEDPAAAVRELARVARGGHVLVTVPWEPWFRLGNLARGRYVGRWGSTPGHLSTWGPRGLRRLLAPVARDGAYAVKRHGAFPWQLAVVPV